MLNISVIIPTYNEEKFILKLLQFLSQYPVHEVIVCDGGSEDQTFDVVRQFESVRWVTCSKKGRAAQMNEGAALSTGDILYFIHADIKLNETFVQDISKTIEQGFDYGCYRYRFDSQSVLLRINAFFTQFDSIFCRGGDQTLFIKKSVFEKIGGFQTDFQIMEDYDILERLRKQNYRFVILPKSILVSARKYERYGYWKVQRAYYTIMIMWKLGFPNAQLYKSYRQMLN